MTHLTITKIYIGKFSCFKLNSFCAIPSWYTKNYLLLCPRLKQLIDNFISLCLGMRNRRDDDAIKHWYCKIAAGILNACYFIRCSLFLFIHIVMIIMARLMTLLQHHIVFISFVEWIEFNENYTYFAKTLSNLCIAYAWRSQIQFNMHSFHCTFWQFCAIFFISVLHCIVFTTDNKMLSINW